ncbi:hypothetical protein OE88DRAFT_1697616 [Heliocybe sulcata]|uniref:Uncharacterized protein n=1 Tax=Heliocybe sulcata TaxID=5364 RepID=A0A5C3N786_9AGAM|nr:hypothetical protein OE88DRAFT_1697616 [Heliocybe sulcata]
MITRLSDTPKQHQAWNRGRYRSRNNEHIANAEHGYPTYLPLSLPPVVMPIHDSVHYNINSSTAAREWAALFPEGGGFVYLGSEYQQFGISMFHQLHCLEAVRRAILDKSASQHTQHCLSYLRQMILCRADLRLEPVIEPYLRREVDASGDRTCRDWTLVYQAVEENHAETKDARRQAIKLEQR